MPDINVKLTQDMNVVPDIPNPLRVGDIVTYKSTDGKIRLEFPDATESLDQDGKTRLQFPDGAAFEFVGPLQMKLLQPGTFQCRCFMTPNGQSKEVGWDPVKSPGSGGDHNVQP